MVVRDQAMHVATHTLSLHCFCVCSYDPQGNSGHASTPEQLDDIMHRIGSDKGQYEAMVAWKAQRVSHFVAHPQHIAASAPFIVSKCLGLPQHLSPISDAMPLHLYICSINIVILPALRVLNSFSICHADWLSVQY